MAAPATVTPPVVSRSAGSTTADLWCHPPSRALTRVRAAARIEPTIEGTIGGAQLVARSDVADILARWREAVRKADSTPPGTHERAAAESRAQQLHLDYLAAVLRMTGQRDEVEGAIESTDRPLAETFDVIERTQDLQRRSAGGLRSGDERLEPEDEAEIVPEPI